MDCLVSCFFFFPFRIRLVSWGRFWHHFLSTVWLQKRCYPDFWSHCGTKTNKPAQILMTRHQWSHLSLATAVFSSSMNLWWTYFREQAVGQWSLEADIILLKSWSATTQQLPGKPYHIYKLFVFKMLGTNSCTVKHVYKDHPRDRFSNE